MKKLIILLLLSFTGFGFIIVNGCHPVISGKKNVAIVLAYNYSPVIINIATVNQQKPMHPLILDAFIKY